MSPLTHWAVSELGSLTPVADIRPCHLAVHIGGLYLVVRPSDFADIRLARSRQHLPVLSNHLSKCQEWVPLIRPVSRQHYPRRQTHMLVLHSLFAFFFPLLGLVLAPAQLLAVFAPRSCRSSELAVLAAVYKQHLRMVEFETCRRYQH